MSQSIKKNISEASVQTDAKIETASDSDSGSSLFLTQSATRAQRTVRRLRPLEDEEETSDTNTSRHEDTTSDSDSGTSFDGLLSKWRARLKDKRSRRVFKAGPRKMAFPFLKKKKNNDSTNFFIRNSQFLANAEIGGFFKCILQNKEEQEKVKQRERRLWMNSECALECIEENEGDDEVEDIKKVDVSCFVLGEFKKRQRTWKPSLKWKASPAPRPPLVRRHRSKAAKQVAQNPVEPQEATNVHDNNRLIDIEVSESRERKSSSCSACSSLSPHSSPSRLSPDQSPFVKSLFVDHQDEHQPENQPQVLVACSESQFLESHQSEKTHRARDNSVEPIHETAIEETQRSRSIDQDDYDDDETQIFEDNPPSKDTIDDLICSLQEHQNQDDGARHEPVENEDSVSVGGGFTSSQDLFQEPNNQASSLKESRVENRNKEFLECNENVTHVIGDLIGKENCDSFILSNVEGNYLKSLNCQRTQPSETISTTAGDIHQERKEKEVKTLGNNLECACPSVPVEEQTGSRGHDSTSSGKDILLAKQEEQCVMFNYLGLTFLKRKKGKKAKTPMISNNPTTIQEDPGEGSGPPLEDTVKWKNRKKVKNKLEESVDAPPEVSVPTEMGISAQDQSMDSVINGNKHKKRRKKDKNTEMLESPVEPLPVVSTELSISAQNCSLDCSPVSGIKLKRKKDKNIELFEEPVDAMLQDSVPTDLGLSGQERSSECSSVSEIKPKKKRKKGKNNEVFEDPVDPLPEVLVPTDSPLPVQDQNMDCAPVSGSKPLKMRKKDNNTELLEEPVDTLPEVRVPTDLGLSAQDFPLDCVSVSVIKSKKKRTKNKNTELLEKTVEPLPQVSVPTEMGISAQDQSMNSVRNGNKHKKKRKNDKTTEMLESPVEPLPVVVSTELSTSAQNCSLDCSPVSGIKVKRKKDKNIELFEEPVDAMLQDSVPTDLGLSGQERSSECSSVSEIKPKKKRKKGKNNEVFEDPVDPLPEDLVPTDFGILVEDCSLDCSSVSGVKRKKRSKRDQNDEVLKEQGVLPEVSVTDLGLSAQDSSEVWSSVSGSHSKKKKKHGQSIPHENEWIDVKHGFHSPNQGSLSLVSIPEKTEQLTRTELSRDKLCNLNSNRDLIQSNDLEPRSKKKKKAAKRDSSPVTSETSESPSGRGTTPVKKKKQRFIGDVEGAQEGTVTMATETVGAPLDKLLDIPEGIEIQTANSGDLRNDNAATSKKKKKKKKRHEEEVEASLMETTEQEESPGNVQESEQQASEVVLLRKLKKQKKKKKDRTETCQEVETPEITTLSLGLGLSDMKTSSTGIETGGIGKEERLGGAEKKKKKKKRKVLENGGSQGVSM